ncbi:hypothetical protein [uncultured Sphingomonas sp.]|uniref:hypothetical protein n=1 Tax=uncultured Sphingomonas sp. TaxID=158754 RepID=UPI0035C9CFDE
MSTRFDRFIAIDWSGARGRWQPGIAVAECGAGDDSPTLVAPPGRAWSRDEVFDWLTALAASGSAALIGLDLSPSLPFEDAGAFFPAWARSPRDAKALWAVVDELAAGEPHFGVSAVVDHDELRHHFRHLGRLSFTGRGRLRRCEERQRERPGLSPSSCFNLVGPAQVGKSSLTGMRVLHALAGRIAVWPFDPVPTSRAVIVEIYTTIAALGSGRPPGRAKMRDAASLDAALRALGCAASGHVGPITDHATDAILSAAWLRAQAGNAALWSPEGLDDVATTEGWTFGVP